jgi:hypothetical protein
MGAGDAWWEIAPMNPSLLQQIHAQAVQAERIRLRRRRRT